MAPPGAATAPTAMSTLAGENFHGNPVMHRDQHEILERRTCTYRFRHIAQCRAHYASTNQSVLCVKLQIWYNKVCSFMVRRAQGCVRASWTRDPATLIKHLLTTFLLAAIDAEAGMPYFDSILPSLTRLKLKFISMGYEQNERVPVCIFWQCSS